MEPVPPSLAGPVAFGSFALDPGERLLLRGGQRIDVQGKPFEILVLLLARAGYLVRKEEFLETVWPGIVVAESNLKHNVSQLRKALEEGGEAAWIETVPRLGYRWVGPLPVPITSVARLVTLSAANPVSPPDDVPIPVPQRRARPGLVLGAVLALGLAAVAGGRLAQDAEGPEPAAEASEAASPLGRKAGREAARIATERGRHLWNQRTSSGLHRAGRLFETALDSDPRYAPAWSGLADVCAFDLARSKEAAGHARRALSLDPSLAQPQATLGFVAMFHDWNLAEARERFDMALQLDPGNVSARQWLALWHALHHDHESAAREIERAISAEPTSLAALADASELAYLAGNDDEALAKARAALELDAGFVNLHAVIERSLARRRRFDEWLAARLRYEEAAGAAEERRRETARSFDEGGYPHVLSRELERLEALGGDPYRKAEILAALGRGDEAIEALRVSFDTRGFHVILAGVNPAFAPLRGDPRFAALLARAGISPPPRG